MASLAEFTYVEGQTPLDADELAGLLPRHITTQGDLNDWEALNILQAHRWLDKAKRNANHNVLEEQFCRNLHRKMFADTWRWAGEFRRSDKNIGITPLLGFARS